MSSFFSGTFFFLALIFFFGTMCGLKKLSMIFFLFFFGALLFLAKCLARKNMSSFFLELIFFLEPILLLALCLAPKSMISFFLGTFFLELVHFFVGTLEPILFLT